MNRILVIDDDDQLRQSFEKLLAEEGFEVFTAASAEAGLDLVNAMRPELVIMDIRLPGMNGMDAFKRMHHRDARMPVIIMTAYGTTETAINATKMGAFDYILKPFDIPEMLSTIRQALAAGRFMRRPVAVNRVPANTEKDAIIGSSPAMQAVYKAIGRVAPTDATVLIRGDSGTGKELTARAVYQHSSRADKPFLVINCVAIPETLLESELFGYEKGAFTGATHRRIGKIEQADGGTVFLDEIGDMPMNLQAKILRLLQEKCVERLGGREAISVDVRIIAATNRHLEEMIAAGSFREDLYYRLKVVTIRLPSLSRRTEDIEALVRFHLARHAADLGLEIPAITKDALDTLGQLPLPGNVRELSNIMQKTLIFNRGAPIGRDDILAAVRESDEPSPPDEETDEESVRRYIRAMVRGGGQSRLFDSAMDRFAAMLIEEALRFSGGNRSQAAKRLGLSRPTLHAKIEKFGMTVEARVSTGEPPRD
jgi:nitrogen regulation protein NR(I)